MNRYLVFKAPTYYPSGGMDDLYEDTNDLEKAIKWANDITDYHWSNIFDLETRQVIYEAYHNNGKFGFNDRTNRTSNLG